MTYIHNFLIAVDQLINTIFFGWPDETMSSRAYRWHKDDVRHWPYKVINALFFWQNDHCRSSYENESKGAQYPPELRK